MHSSRLLKSWFNAADKSLSYWDQQISVYQPHMLVSSHLKWMRFDDINFSDPNDMSEQCLIVDGAMTLAAVRPLAGVEKFIYPHSFAEEAIKRGMKKIYRLESLRHHGMTNDVDFLVSHYEHEIDVKSIVQNLYAFKEVYPSTNPRGLWFDCRPDMLHVAHFIFLISKEIKKIWGKPIPIFNPNEIESYKFGSFFDLTQEQDVYWTPFKNQLMNRGAYLIQPADLSERVPKSSEYFPLSRYHGVRVYDLE